ncbi:coxsackievirus and adenovirus receptor-like [Trachinotus anak]|uniref:coxsackievirus and adenovirus receptor-like n=1 Tax=Trachinotus anak TaxID=443729 RepID=UPI0039F176FF
MDFLTVFLICSLVCVTTEQQDVEVKLEQNVILQCQSPGSETIQVLKWSRPDLKSDGYVYFYRNKRSYETYQHPSFHGRVELRDPEMKEGDVSVVLKNVTVKDAGRYECYVSEGNMRDSKTTHSEIRHLTITDSGKPPGSTWGSQTLREDADGRLQVVLQEETVAALTVAAVAFCIVVVVVVVVVFKSQKGEGCVNKNKPWLIT